MGDDDVTPSRVCELKYEFEVLQVTVLVTPSRVCELKFVLTEERS